MRADSAEGTESTGGVEYGILGPLSITIGGEPVRIGKNRQLVVLAMLLSNVNRTVTVEKIIDAVWGETPPATADKQIQTCVWRLRSALTGAGAHPGVIETGQGGYQLRLGDGDTLDARLFEDLARRGRGRVEIGDLTGAAEDYRAALSLFHGSTLSNVVSMTLDAVVAYWEERKLSVLEERVEIELALGRHAELTSELTLLVAEFPLREQLRAQLMTALYRADRRADALAVYRAGRAALVDNLGLDPGSRLQDLQRRIIAGEPPAATSAAPRAVTRTPAQLPADLGDFVGRCAELDAIRTEIRRAQDTTPGAVGVVGRGGVGKSALAIHAANQLREHFPDGQLYAALGGTEPLEPSEVLKRLLHSLGVPGQRVPQSLAARAAMFRSVVAGKRLLVLLDDVADFAEMELLMPGDTACTVLFTSQSSMAEVPGVRVTRLDGLRTDDALTLLESLVGPARVAQEPESAEQIVELCGHLPLAIRGAAARLASRPAQRLARFVWRLRDEEGRIDELTYGSLDPGGRLTASATRLSPAARRLWLQLSAAEFDPIPVRAGAAAADLSEGHAQRLLDELLDRQLLDIAGADGHGGPCYSFHSLLRIQARLHADTELSPEHRAEAHTRLARWQIEAREAELPVVPSPDTVGAITPRVRPDRPVDLSA